MNAFKKCQFCGFESQDICEFRMWQECDEQDQPIPDKMLITCKKDSCFQRIDADPKLFNEIPWSRGGPGKFMLICGNCEHRQGFACKHPNLKANGGSGLEVKFSQFPPMIRVHTADGCSIQMGQPAVWCEGNPKSHRD